MRSGDLLLKCIVEGDIKLILHAKEMMGKKISASLHKILNVCRGVISMSELIDVPCEDILVNLRDQQVIDVCKLKIRKNNEYITTKNVVLTFDRATLPDKVKVGYLSAEVHPYVPNPLRCFRCNRFRHAADACRGSPCCARCGQSDHEAKECKGPDQLFWRSSLLLQVLPKVEDGKGNITYKGHAKYQLPRGTKASVPVSS